MLLLKYVIKIVYFIFYIWTFYLQSIICSDWFILLIDYLAWCNFLCCQNKWLALIICYVLCVFKLYSRSFFVADVRQQISNQDDVIATSRTSRTSWDVYKLAFVNVKTNMCCGQTNEPYSPLFIDRWLKDCKILFIS